MKEVHHAARKSVVLHTHMRHATALTLTAARALDTRLSQTAMRFHGRVAVDAHYNGLALDMSEGERIANAMHGGVDGVNPSSTSEGQASLFLNRYERKVLPACGHFPQREDPEQVAQELIRFLAA